MIKSIKKKYKNLLCICITVVLIALGMILMEGCKLGLSREEITKNALKNKYGEEFNVYEIEVDGSEWNATVSLVNNPEILFWTTVDSDGTVKYDDYYHAYVGYLMEKQLREDLEQFFPDAFIHVWRISMRWEGGNDDFRNMPLEDVIAKSSMEGIMTSGCHFYIFIDKQKGTKKNYEGEYEYFTKTVDDYIDKNKMIPLIVTFVKVDSDTINRVKEYVSKDLDYDGVFEKEILGVDNFRTGINYFNKTDLGNPTNVGACFDKNADGYVGDYEEYLRRREMFENDK